MVVDLIERLRKINDTNISYAPAFNIAIDNITNGTNCVAAPSSLLKSELVILRLQKKKQIC